MTTKLMGNIGHKEETEEATVSMLPAVGTVIGLR